MSTLASATAVDPLAQLPPPNQRRIALQVTPAAERAIRSGHPWLFAKAIRQQSFAGQAGDLAVIFDQKRRFLAIGLYDPSSPIRVRILQAGQSAPIDAAWLQQKLHTAVGQRETLPGQQTTGYRLVHGENDGLPGLIIDRYDDTAVIKLYSAAWLPYLPWIAAGLTAVVPCTRLVLRLNRALQQEPARLHGLQNGHILQGPPLTGHETFLENGLRFAVDVQHGQKTGFFLDQRDNRAYVGQLAEGKRVLNLFAYSGGFSLYAARGGARSVLSVDMSQPALATAVHNFSLNQTITAVARCQHQTLAGDIFRLLPQMQQANEQYDLVVVDPPAFAKKREEVDGALNAYGRLVRLALAVLAPGGILVMASCSSQVAADPFFQLVHQNGAKVGRPLREIKRTGHAIDHPIGFAEGAYLKCLFAQA